jgi:NitT/TauT family transport system substrate-binding protein
MSDYGVELYGNVVMVSPKFAAEKPEAVRGLLRAITKGVRDTVADPELGGKLVIQRNDVAKLEVEVERLKMTIAQNVMTPAVKADGFGGIDKARWERALDQIGLTFTFKDKAKAGAAFDDSYLPPVAERKF